MSERVRVVRHEGRLLAAKDSGTDGDAVRAEADLLARSQVPGVVELVGTSGGERPALLTVWVGPRSLADLPRPMGPGAAAALCIAVAATVSRLHRVGVVHGAIDASHVLLDADGRPVLCGFGRGGPIGAPVRRPTTDPAPASADESADPSTLRPAVDVHGLGRLLEHLLGPDLGGPHGSAPWRLGGRRTAATRRALLTVAAQATVPDPAGRPSVTAFARAVRRAAPDAALGPVGTLGETAAPAPGAGRTIRPRPSTSPGGLAAAPAAGRPDRHRRPPVSTGLVLVAVVAIGATAWFGLRAWSTPSPTRSITAMAPTPPSPRATPTTARTPVPSTASTATPTTTTTVEVPPPSADAPDGAPVVVEHDGRRYAVGAPGDVVAVGPWLCDGRDLAVVLRPDDGTLHLFDEWPDGGATTTSRAVATVSGALALDPVADGAGCAALLVSDDDTVLATLGAADLS